MVKGMFYISFMLSYPRADSTDIVKVLNEEIAAVNVFSCGLCVFEVSISWFTFWSLSLFSLLDYGDIFKCSFPHIALII